MEDAATRLVLLQSIQDKIEDRVFGLSAVLDWPVGQEFLKETARYVLDDIGMADETHIPTLEELWVTLHQQPGILDDLVEDFILPRLP